MIKEFLDFGEILSTVNKKSLNRENFWKRFKKLDTIDSSNFSKVYKIESLKNKKKYCLKKHFF